MWNIDVSHLTSKVYSEICNGNNSKTLFILKEQFYRFEEILDISQLFNMW
jgi:hypothetical protein